MGQYALFIKHCRANKNLIIDNIIIRKSLNCLFSYRTIYWIVNVAFVWDVI